MCSVRHAVSDVNNWCRCGSLRYRTLQLPGREEKLVKSKTSPGAVFILDVLLVRPLLCILLRAVCGPEAVSQSLLGLRRPLPEWACWWWYSIHSRNVVTFQQVQTVICFPQVMHPWPLHASDRESHCPRCYSPLVESSRCLIQRDMIKVPRD